MEKKSKKSIIIGVTSLLLVTLLLVGLTYAYYRTRIIGNESTSPSISVQSKKMEITYEDGSAVLSTTGKIEPGFTASKTFYVKNTGSETVTYSVILDEMTNDFDRNQDWQVTLTKNGTSVISASDNKYLAVGTHQILLPSESIVASGTETPTTDTYVLTVTYLNSEEDQSEDMGRQLSFKVNIGEESYTWDSAPEGSLLAAIKTDSPSLPSTEDDYGMSYYYTGAVENNYVTYSNMCWRIVRVQGDGTIKLILADSEHPCGTANGYVADGQYAVLTDESGNPRGIPWSVSGIYSMGELEYQWSVLPSVLDMWVDEKGLDMSKLTKTDWCNDMSIEKETYLAQDNYTKVTEEEAYRTETEFSAASRRSNPTLKCNMKGLKNSKALRYQENIALLTTDEAYLAGDYGSYLSLTNINLYRLWSMTPAWLSLTTDLNGVSILHGFVSGDGSVSSDNSDMAVRPVVALRSDVTLDTTVEHEQNGGVDTPYIIG